MNNNNLIGLSPKKCLKWTAALRSGKYKKTINRLQNNRGYCCLGVGCDIFIPKNLLQVDSKGIITGSIPTMQAYSPEWLKDVGSDFKQKTGISLTLLNDNKRFTFNEISDMLELVYVHKALD